MVHVFVLQRTCLCCSPWYRLVYRCFCEKVATRNYTSSMSSRIAVAAATNCSYRYPFIYLNDRLYWVVEGTTGKNSKELTIFWKHGQAICHKLPAKNLLNAFVMCTIKTVSKEQEGPITQNTGNFVYHRLISLYSELIDGDYW